MGQRVLSRLLGEGCWPCRCPPPWLLGPPLLVLVLFPCQRQWKLFVAEACCFRCCRGFAPSGANYPWGSQPIYQPGTWIMGVPWFKTALVVGSSLFSGGTDVFTCMPGERYRSRPMSLLLCLCYVRSLLLCLCYVRSLLLCLCYVRSLLLCLCYVRSLLLCLCYVRSGLCCCVCVMSGLCCCVCVMSGLCCCVCVMSGLCCCVCVMSGLCCCVCVMSGLCCCVCVMAFKD